MIRLTLLLIVSLFIAGSGMAQEASTATERLTKQGEQFQERIIKIADNVYTAVGFSVSNVSMIVGDDGVVIVDTGMMLDDAGRIAAEYRKLSDIGDPDHATDPAHQSRTEAENHENSSVIGRPWSVIGTGRSPA